MSYRFWILLLIILGLRVFIYYETVPDYPDGTLIRIKTNVRSEPLRFENSQYLKIKGFKVYLPKYPEIGYGDNVVVEGVVYENSLKKAKIIDLSDSGNILFNLRERLLRFYQRSLPPKHSGLVAGMVLGSKSGIDTIFWEKLKNSGTVHVVVASGMNVSLVAKFLISIWVIFLPRRKAIPFAFIGIWIYAFLSGLDAPIVRAGIMGSLTFIAQELGKMYYAGRALIFTSVLMVFIKPEWISDLGFILSFVATASILLLDEPLRNMFKKVPDILKGDLSSSLSAQIGVAPILYASFGQFNILSPLYNLLVLWTVPIVTVVGMVAGIVSLIFVPLGQYLLYLVYPFTSWFIFWTTKI